MPEPKKEIGGWTLETLKTYVESLIEGHKAEDNLRFAAQEKAMETALAAAQAAVDKAEKATHERFASVNEFRQALSDQTKNYVPRELHDRLVEDMQTIKTSQAARAGLPMQIDENTRRLGELEAWRAAQTGANARSERTFNGTVAMIGLLAAVATAMATFALIHH